MLHRTLAAGIFPALFLIFGLSISSKITMSDQTKEAIEQLIAGIFFAIISIQIVPLIEVIKDFKHKMAVIFGIILSTSIMITLTYLSSKEDLSVLKKVSLTDILPIFIDNMINGFISCSLANKIEGYKGYIAAVLLSLDNLIIGIHIGNKLSTITNGDKSIKTVVYFAILPFATLIGGMFAWIFTSKMKNTPLEYSIFAFSIASLLWAISTELIPLKPTKNILYPLMMYIGFLFIVITSWFT